jgi:phage tail sheath protein FI
VDDAKDPLDPDGPLSKQRGYVQSARGYAALYYPWIAVANPLGQPATVLVPPSGHLAGVYARNDSQRGVHKAPANEMITGALGLQDVLDDSEQGVLNNWGIDVIRIFPGQARPVIWGARTTAPKDELPWRFINVRRLFIFIEKSIQSGIRWAVFEPNSVTLWKQLARTITEFLTRVWGSGALVGRSANEAFYVKIDEELNPPSLQAAGQVVVEIGIAPVRPAEFVIVRISMWNGSTSVSEE